MKLYYGIRKRLAKKLIGWGWHKMNYARKLKVGDLVSTCKGYNEVIKEINPHYVPGRKAIYDFSFLTETGSYCSAIHCCTFPLETKEEIVRYFMDCEYKCGLIDALKAGEDVFDENGCLRPEFQNVEK